MNVFSFYTRVYDGVHKRYSKYRLFNSLCRLVIRHLANIHIRLLYGGKKYPNLYSPHRESGERIIISLTSFPARINTIWIVILSLFYQTVKPDKIILWLSKKQFNDENDIPSNLKNLQNDVFEIRFVEEDYRSHKKYYYSFGQFPNEVIITVDDDVIYNPKMIESLVRDAELYPGAIIANNTNIIVFDNQGKVTPYENWRCNTVSGLSNSDLLQVGIGGVLYPPHSLYRDVLNPQIFLRVTPLADDIWLNTMARLNDTKIVQSSNYVLVLPVIIKSNQSLTSINNALGKNNEQIDSIRRYYLDNLGIDPYGKDEKKITNLSK